MAYRNYYRVVLSNDFLGVSKEISAPTRYDLMPRLKIKKNLGRKSKKRDC